MRILQKILPKSKLILRLAQPLKRPSVACKTKEQPSHLVILIVFLYPQLKLNKTIPANSTTEDGFHAGEPLIDDAALDRLMSETDVQMLEPAGSSHRDAISQLKAAVAAKQAAHKVGHSDNHNQEVENAFRNDLSLAIRSRVTISATNTGTTVHSNTHSKHPCPTPLKLVTAQRINVEGVYKTHNHLSPLVPHHIAFPRDDNKALTTEPFAEFAKNMGATELPELLEASAAYTAFVEGANECE
jgi:hypothetical protein